MAEPQVCETGQPLPLWEARVKELVREVIREEGSKVPLHVREENHRFVENCRFELQAFLEERKRTRERREKVRTTVIGGAILGALSAAGSFLYWIGTVVINALSHPMATDAAQHLDKLPPR